MTMIVPARTTFFTSDTHFFHKAMVDRRGYKEIDEMNTDIINQWNSVVPTDGIVFHLGDVSFAGTDKTVSVLGQLNGQMHLVKGNHDKTKLNSAVRDMFYSVQDYLEIDVEEAPAVRQRIILSHYSHRVWNKHHYGSWHLFGHSHGTLEGIGKSMDVGIDTGIAAPYSYELIKYCMREKIIHVIDHHVTRNDTTS